ncbi:bacteriocin fulvocin C-related protein [Flaviramulus sp. BrNp1-15]|uniref:bacteriocin fulvocin C-related protein n=1 Tax=Flaviramulus sp. BrNp1-15 TaxID=2916754 RepID=UPI001EE7AC51|nr:bacteriocin fulvocin C-related protein [Flaviramulus sp. BrNp1-15]ULC59980.1 bacteriocin fulvocin C-related protein [Flaviramulus sp. BrNp1-15]
MKKYFVYLFVSLCFLQSCEVTETESQKELIEFDKVENLKTLSVDNQRVAFKLLKNESKAFLWKNRLDNLLNSEDLSSNQRTLIVELQNYINPNLYDNGSAEFSKLDNKVKDWAFRSENHFTRYQLSTYFTRINNPPAYSQSGPGDDDSPIVPPVGQGGGGGDDCACNTSEDYCLWGANCDNSLNCETSYKGCGLLWNSPCNGLCD